MDWFTAEVKTNAEEKATFHLERQGFGVLRPAFMKTARHARQVRKVRKPLFPGYVFVQFDAGATRWTAINSTIGVKRLLCQHNTPTPVPGAFMSGLIRSLDENQLLQNQPHTYVVGDKVELIGSVFEGQIATILNANNWERVQILLSIMGRNVVSTVSVDQIERAI